VRRAAVLWPVLALCLALFAPAAEAAGAPQLGSAWASGASESGVTLNAEVNPNGLATTYHFDYLTEAAYLANLAAGKDGFGGAAKAPPGADPSAGSGTAAVTVSRAIGSLPPDTVYRYRLVAANGAGALSGPARTFATLPLATSSFMLDGRGWELVTPLDKNGGQAEGPGEVFGGGVFQAAAAGSALTFSSTYSFADPAGAPAGSQYLARRGAAGWATDNLTTPIDGGTFGDEPDGAPFQLFSPGLGRGLALDPPPCAAEPCPRRYSLRELASGATGFSPQRPDLRFAGASADLSQVVLSTCAALTADAVEAPGAGGCDPAQLNLYLWSAGGLSLVNLLPGDAQGTPGASLAAQAGAVSSSGDVYFTHGSDLYLRQSVSTRQVDAVVGGGATFEAASASGALAFYSKGGHLYRYEAAGAGSSIDLTPAGGLLGVLGASATGEYVYYLTVGGLFLRHALDPPVTVAAAADSSSYPPVTGPARVTPDGVHLAFLSSASLTGYDNRGALNGPPAQVGVPQSEVFLYDAASATLICASCNPSGERPLGPASIPGAIANGVATTATRAYKPRVLSDDGRRLFFDSADDLALRDRDRFPPRPDADVYEWEAPGAGSCSRVGGCVALVSNGRGTAGSSFLDASASGADIFFLTADSLVTADGGFVDIYDAREGGGFPEPPKPIECVGDACQPLPPEPEDRQPSTLVPSPGNPSPRVVSSPARCKKGFVKKRGRCVRKPRKHRGRR
jgi:hypothetical protein